MSPQRIRSVNFTPQEIILLVDIVTKYKEVLENRHADSVCWKQKNLSWEEITNEFNEKNGNVHRDTKTLRLKYDCLKREVRNKVTRNKIDLNSTCNSGNKPMLLNYEEKLAKMLSIGVVCSKKNDENGNNFCYCHKVGLFTLH